MNLEVVNFASLGFAAGVVRGCRTWRANSDGWLTGLYYRQVWLTGVNQAVCMKPTWPRGMYPGAPGLDMADQHFEIPDIGHLPSCRCGLYGYYDGSNDYYKPRKTERNLVAGIIEGFGEVLIGERGFRAMKARIVALHFPDTLVYPGLVLEQYPDIPVFSTFEQMEAEFPCHGDEADD